MNLLYTAKNSNLTYSYQDVELSVLYPNIIVFQNGSELLRSSDISDVMIDEAGALVVFGKPNQEGQKSKFRFIAKNDSDENVISKSFKYILTNLEYEGRN